MPDMTPTKRPMPLLDPVDRVKTFDEVATGYSAEDAAAESLRCLNCKNKPCVSGCPVGIDIPAFISELRNGNISEARRIIGLSSSLPAVCGRVCPQENQCEKHCVRGIKGEPVGIGRLERFVADNAHAGCSERPVPTGKKAAVIGSGPAGLACAGALAAKGVSVTVYEALHVPGGVLVYGIPQFRLPKEIVADEIKSLKDMGVEFVTDCVVGKTITLSELREENDAVFIGSGAGLPGFMGIEGENLNGVFSANEFLTRVNLMKAYREDSATPVMHAKNVAVIGGGNVAMDAARCAKRLGAEKVYIVYRRSEQELPARREEVEHAKEEGIIFRLLTNPVAITGENGFASGIECAVMTLGDPDESGRRKPIDSGERVHIDADCVIMALGTSPNPLITRSEPGLATGHKGCIEADDNGKTSLPGVYAGGDAVTGAATVILAMGAGKKAAAAICEYLGLS